jgi:hypothetical protein
MTKESIGTFVVVSCTDNLYEAPFLFHIDGAPTVKSKILNISRSPIQRILVELPASIRYSLKDELFCVLFQSQKHFVDQVKAINR